MNSAAPALLEALSLASRALDTAGLRHVFIGGIAVSAWSRPRTTLDLDVLVLSPGSSAEPVVRALRAEGFELDRTGIHQDAMLAGFRAMVRPSPHGSPISLDVLVSDNPVVEEIVLRARRRDLAGTVFSVPTPEDLIVLKLQAGRPQDLADARALFDAQATTLDRDLLESQAHLFGLAGALDALKER
jgi:predicted nucleotidyltransferase